MLLKWNDKSEVQPFDTRLIWTTTVWQTIFENYIKHKINDTLILIDSPVNYILRTDFTTTKLSIDWNWLIECLEVFKILQSCRKSLCTVMHSYCSLCKNYALCKGGFHYAREVFIMHTLHNYATLGNPAIVEKKRKSKKTSRDLSSLSYF